MENIKKLLRRLYLSEWVSEMRARVIARGYIEETPSSVIARSRQYEAQMFKPHPVLGKYQEVGSYFTSAHKFRLDERADWTGVPPELQQLAYKIQSRLRRMHIPVYVHSCYRSPSLQQMLVDAGHSKVLSGAHQRSAAVDIVHNHFHWNCDKEFWDLLGRVAFEEAEKLTMKGPPYDDPKRAKRTKMKINWGGNWSFYDPAHIELADWKDRPIVLGEGYAYQS